jgi:hypothetical protein
LVLPTVGTYLDDDDGAIVSLIFNFFSNPKFIYCFNV